MAKLRNGSPCRSAATDGQFCAYHAALADHLGNDAVANGDHTKQRNPRQRERVLAETEPLQPNASTSKSPSAVRPALALTAMEELETIRSVLLEAATSTTRETWATCTCPECGKGFRQEISVPDHGARIKAIETLLREGLGRVGEAEALELKIPPVEELGHSARTVELVVALGYASEIHAVLDHGDDALRSRSRTGSRRRVRRSRACSPRSHELGRDLISI